ncbi:MAG: hypothetical protein GXP52_09960 [Deltaproteobacteria bacterium]|nr:hypothetical protein [Deltaproteobacteria bacterium]
MPRFHPLLRIIFVFFFAATPLFFSVDAVPANDGVYSLLPPDIEVIQYRLGDIDSDGLKEMGLLFRWKGKVHLTVFRSGNGRWARWWDLAETSSPEKGLSLYSFDMIDSNGDGACEISLYLLAPGGGGMTTRILAFTGTGDNGPHFETILEDVTMPPGYPIYGTEKGNPSVTFLNMGGESVDGTKRPGYRRVYCWNSTRFEKCLEVKWKTP